MQPLGTFHKATDGYQVILERLLPHPINTVWDALTNPAILSIWFTSIEMDFRPGGNLTIRFQDEAKTISHGKIVTIEKPHRFSYTWEEELAEWRLEALADNETKLTLVYSKLPAEYALSVPAGWHELLDQLISVLAGRTKPYPFGGEPTPEGKALQQKYKTMIQQQFPELATKENTIDGLVMERWLDAPLEKVWRALTDVEQMRQWYFDLPAFKAEPGFNFTFSAGSHDEQWVHHCRVTTVIPLSRIAYTWRYEGYAGESEVSFELFEENGKTKLVLTHKGLDTFPQDIPALHQENFTKGWRMFIDERLSAYLLK